MKPKEVKRVLLRGKVDLILDAIASLDPYKEVRDPQLKRILDSLMEHVTHYYDPYAVAVRPPGGDPMHPDPRTRDTRRRPAAKRTLRRRSR